MEPRNPPLGSKEATASAVAIDADALTVDLADGRSITVPLAWFPRLIHASKEECANWTPIATGKTIPWPDLDEDISIAGLLAGHGSMESQHSLPEMARKSRFQKWNHSPQK